MASPERCGGRRTPGPGGGEWTEAVAREIAFDRSQGFTDHKIKVGGLPVAEDADRVAGDCPLWWFEEPLSPDAIIGHAELDPNPGGGFASSPAPASPSSTPDCRQPGRPGTPAAGRTWPNCA